ncbi:hypothetical protein T11_6850 [Trichinella zimbabwensis]|uniref:Uncharacterized protein n=1 Tax=Trichinella zimbabwensis TaxID=268475 RepID=A0A0V1HVP4_9BILA|nr:hypothetical protein T11_6850 [Trichinella zimbabwensis]
MGNRIYRMSSFHSSASCRPRSASCRPRSASCRPRSASCRPRFHFIFSSLSISRFSKKSNTTKKTEYFSVILKRTSAANERHNELREHFDYATTCHVALESSLRENWKLFSMLNSKPTA